MGLNQCDECAFKPGAVANKEPYNHLRSEVCALSARPFFCHHSWANQRQECRTAGTCAGWRARVQELKKKGWFTDKSKVATRRWVGEYILAQIEEFISTTGAEKRRATRAIKSSLRILLRGRFKFEARKVHHGNNSSAVR